MKRKIAAAILCASMVMNLGGGLPVLASEEGNTGIGIELTEFANPSKEYQPGVRWWWPGGAVEKETLKKEIDYLAENNFGYVEINPFYLSQALEGDEETAKSIYTPEFYELLDYAVGYCEEKGITVDLNMGSGWNANSQYVTYEETMGNMALGRVTVTAEELRNGVDIPEAERSVFYVGDDARGEWQDESVKLQGILVAELTGETGTEFAEREGLFGSVPAYTEVYDAEGNVSKEYPAQVVLNLEHSYYLQADETMGEETVTLTDEILGSLDDTKEYEVIAMYYVPSGGTGVDCEPEWYVADHMDAETAADYINDWLGDANMKQILDSHSNIRAVFNDSYEFYSDIYYTEDMAELAADAENNGLGYDFTKYLPTIYKQYSAAPFYMGLGTSDTYLTYTADEGEKARIQYDYNTLVNQKFQEGMAAFQEASNGYELLYRQEAYNPPIDTLASANYVDIPEGEQGDEMSLIRTSSGAHLYGKNLVTCEQYTLGCTPLMNTLEQVKIGYDNMATSGITNFFYHGLMYGYGVDSEEYGEMGWTPFPTTGINMSERNSLSPYFGEMNEYASRVNYLMQQGSPSKDVAYYMPFNGSLSETDAVTAMNSAGYAWDAINDDSIQSEETTVSEDGTILVNGGNMEYDAIVVDSASVPVATMEKLQAMAEQGAAIIFSGAAPSAQPGWADGNYAEEDAKVAAASEAILAASNSALAEDVDTLKTVLAEKVTPKVSYEDNDQVRFARRTLDNGAELVYLRNIGEGENTITLELEAGYGECYWLDQSTGEVYAAEKDGDTITVTLEASQDTYSDKHSMAIALICEPEGTEIAAEELTEGTPKAFADTTEGETTELTVDSLTVGDTTYTDQVLGKWNSDDFQGGALKTSADTGSYHATYTLTGSLDGKSAELSLSNVYTAATVLVNGEEAGKLMYAPYTLDITEYLTEGENEIEIQVTPRKYNKINPEAETLVDTGMEGPVTITVK